MDNQVEMYYVIVEDGHTILDSTEMYERDYVCITMRIHTSHNITGMHLSSPLLF